MNNPRFIWERNGEELIMDPRKSYLVYYRGCFCPPHVGHFNTVVRYLQHNNVRIIIHQMGGTRHGISINTNRKIWELYINDLLPSNHIDLIQYNEDTMKLPRSHRWFMQCDYLVIIRGDETQNIKHQEKKDMSRWKPTINRCLRYDVELIFDYSTRDTSIISATVFTKNLIGYQRGRLGKSDLYKFLPDRLSIENKDRIIRTLARYRLR